MIHHLLFKNFNGLPCFVYVRPTGIFIVAKEFVQLLVVTHVCVCVCVLLVALFCASFFFFKMSEYSSVPAFTTNAALASWAVVLVSRVSSGSGHTPPPHRAEQCD